MSILPLLRRRRRLILSASAALLASYSIYKLHRLFSSLSAAASASLSTLSLLSSDLHSFLTSDSDQLPNSLHQLSKIVASDEASSSLSTLSQSITLGIVRGIKNSQQNPQIQESTTYDQLFNKLFSPSGTGFASTVAGSFARNLVLGFQESQSSSGDSELIRMICSEQGRKVVGDWIQGFVSTAVSVYLDKTMDINFYDDVFAGLTNPKHDGKMREMIVSVCNGAMETLVRTSHKVLTSSNAESSGNTRAVDVEVAKERGSDRNGGWAEQVASTLAVPRNRSFVLDVTGRITFETVRSFLDFGLWKLYDGVKRGVDLVQTEFVENGLEVVRFFSARSRVVITICIVLCMNVFMRTRVLMTA